MPFLERLHGPDELFLLPRHGLPAGRVEMLKERREMNIEMNR